MADTFPDRRERLFGREPDVHHLVDRAPRTGLTAVAGRPLMGKTWTLMEVARRLLEERRYLVGYHESTGGESSHLLYAVSDLYVRWLRDSTMRKQAISLWRRHRGGLVPRIGQLMGELFEKLGKGIAPDAVTHVVRAVFDGLAQAQTDLRSGGLQLPALPYDQALSLTRLVAEVSQRRVVLILDAWEKAPSLEVELNVLQAILKSPDAWRHAHVFIAVRNPEVDSTTIDQQAYLRAKDLCRISRSAELYDLPLMNQADLKERARIVDFVWKQVPAARGLDQRRILEMIDGYPGVLNFWADETAPLAGRTLDDLERDAHNAHALRYMELSQLLNELRDGPIAIAARLAFLPRFDAQYWAIFENVVLKDRSTGDMDVFGDGRVLGNARVPTYGHDTRHTAAQRWFLENRRPLFRRIAEECVETLAAKVTGLQTTDRYYCEALVACTKAAAAVGIDAALNSLIDAARFFLSDVALLEFGVLDHSHLVALERNPLFSPLLAQALTRRGLMRYQLRQDEGAHADFTALVKLPSVPTEIVARALNLRAIISSRLGDKEAAIADYSTVVELPGVSAEQAAFALNNRGITHGELGDSEAEIADLTEAQQLDAPATPVAMARYNLGIARKRRGNVAGAIAVFTAVVELADAPAEHVASALVERGILKGRIDDQEGAVVDFTAAIELPDAPADSVGLARLHRAIARMRSGDYDGAIADATMLRESSDVPVHRVVSAVMVRGVAKSRAGNKEGAITDLTAAALLPDAPVEGVAAALFDRGIVKNQMGDRPGAIADFTEVSKLSEAPVTLVASALNRRGIVKYRNGDSEGAIADFTAVAELANAPVKRVAAALIMRAIVKYRKVDSEGAIDDLRSVEGLHAVPSSLVDAARFRLTAIQSAARKGP